MAVEDPGPEPRDLRGTMKVLALCLVAMFVSLVCVGMGWLLADRLGWGSRGFALGIVLTFAAMGLLAALVRRWRRNARPLTDVNHVRLNGSR